MTGLRATYRQFDPADPRMPHDLLAFRPQVAFIAMHGAGGEDGTIQGFLDTAGIPYVGSGVDASMMCMNKLYTKWAFEALHIPTPRWALVDPYIYMEKRTVQKRDTLPAFPAVAKPLTEGSSVGVKFLQNEEELHALLEKIKTPLIVEERIVGREITLPLMGEPMKLMPVIEIRPKAEFFDFDAKYTKGMTEYICPADIPADLRERLSRYGEQLCRALNLRHMCRIDVMLSGHGDPFFLEINTIPGLTETSLLPMSARAAGIEFPELIQRLIKMGGGVA